MKQNFETRLRKVEAVIGPKAYSKVLMAIGEEEGARMEAEHPDAFIITIVPRDPPGDIADRRRK